MDVLKALVVVDMQNDFVNGVLGTEQAMEIVPEVCSKISKYRNSGYEIVFTKDTHFEDYLNTQEGENLPVTHCVENTYGWEIVDEIKNMIMPEDKVFCKNAFGSIELAKYLKDYDEIVFLGVCTDICVISNAVLLKSFSPETKVSVIKSCVAGVTPKSNASAIETMKSLQIKII